MQEILRGNPLIVNIYFLLEEYNNMYGNMTIVSSSSLTQICRKKVSNETNPSVDCNSQLPPIRSRSYRFRVRNGGYIVVETDWSCFINPWSKKLEFVIGKHTVLKGPPKPDVFAEGNSDGLGGEITRQKGLHKQLPSEVINALACFHCFYCWKR